MSVNSIDNNNNNAAIIAGSTIVGGGVGAAAGYYTKPWLKDDMPTDTFVKKIGENLRAGMPADTKNALEALDSMNNLVKNSKTVEDFAKAEFDAGMKLAEGKSFEEFKSILKQGAEISLQNGMMEEDEALKYIEKLDASDSLDALKTNVKDFMNETYSGKTVEELKASTQNQLNKMKEIFGFSNLDDMAKSAFDKSYDTSDKKLVYNAENINEEAFKAVKKAANSIQGKAAMLWGAIGAAVLGLGAFAVTAMNSKKQTPVEEQPALKETQA